MLAAGTKWRRDWAAPAICIMGSLSWIGDASAADLIGVATDQQGKPVARITVQLLPATNGQLPIATTTTTTDGRYVLPGVAPGQYRLKCGDGPDRLIKVGYGIIRFDCQR